MSTNRIDPAAIREHAQKLLHHVTKAEGLREAGADDAGEMAEAERHLIAAANQFGRFCDPIDETVSEPAEAAP